MFLFFVNTYSGAQEINSEIVNVIVKTIHCEDNNQYDLMIMVDIDEGWFIFSEVPVSSSFQPFQIMIQLPNGHEKSGDPLISSTQPKYIAKGLSVYDGFFVFTQHVQVNTIKESQDIKCEILYQAGELNNIHPIKMKKITLKI